MKMKLSDLSNKLDIIMELDDILNKISTNNKRPSIQISSSDSQQFMMDGYDIKVSRHTVDAITKAIAEKYVKYVKELSELDIELDLKALNNEEIRKMLIQ